MGRRLPRPPPKEVAGGGEAPSEGGKTGGWPAAVVAGTGVGYHSDGGVCAEDNIGTPARWPL